MFRLATVWMAVTVYIIYLYGLGGKDRVVGKVSYYIMLPSDYNTNVHVVDERKMCMFQWSFCVYIFRIV